MQLEVANIDSSNKIKKEVREMILEGYENLPDISHTSFFILLEGLSR